MRLAARKSAAACSMVGRGSTRGLAGAALWGEHRFERLRRGAGTVEAQTPRALAS
jgi:hypothetical protein